MTAVNTNFAAYLASACAMLLPLPASFRCGSQQRIVALRSRPFLIVCLGFAAASCQGQSFKNPRLIPTALDPNNVAAADFNQDGNVDLAYVDGHSPGSALHILLGDGTGSFRHGQDVALPAGICSYACYINLGDINGDGILDIVLGGGTPNTSPQPSAPNAMIAALLGNGDGSFGTPVVSDLTINSGSTPNMVFAAGIADVNGDGATDLIIPDPAEQKLYVLLGDKTGSFTYSTSIFDGNSPFAVIATDLNGDGRPDLLVYGPAGGAATVFLNTGAGNFGSGTNYTAGPGASFVLADVNGDGVPDLVASVYVTSTSQQATQQVVYLAGRADGTFGVPVTIADTVSGNLIYVADYNGDGIPDLVVQNATGIAVLPGKGSISWGVPIPVVAGAVSEPYFFGMSTRATGDFNNDGRPDFAIAVEGGIALLLGRGNGTFDTGDAYDIGEPTGATAVGPFTSNAADIAVTVPAEFPRLLVGAGNGTFTLATDPNTSYTTVPPDRDVATGDFDGNGTTDLVEFVTTGANSPAGQVYFGTGKGTFAAPVQVTNGSPFLADFNRDGHTDMVNVSGSNLVVELGQVGGFTEVATPLRTATFAQVIAAGDVNRDGVPDVIIKDEAGIEVWLGKADGTFTYASTIDAAPLGGFAAGAYGATAIADLDGDGNPDLVLAPGNTNVPQALAILYGNGHGTFGAPVLQPVSHAYLYLSVADVNHDGKADLVLSDAEGIAVVTNLGGGSFGPEVHYIAGASISKPNVADLNGDGYPDIVAANPGGTTVSVLLNEAGTGTSSVLPGMVTVSPEPSKYQQAFTMTLTLQAPAQGTAPTGNVAFYVDSAYAGTAALSSGMAAFTWSGSLMPGSHAISAGYEGDANYDSSTYMMAHTVNDPDYTTTNSLTATPVQALTSETIHLQAVVASTGPVPVGWVTFLDGSASLGGAWLDKNGIAVLDTAILGAGTHNITARYQGTTTQENSLPTIFEPSTSAPVNVTITSIPTTTTLSASSGSPTAGTVDTFTASVSATSGTPFGSVSFADNGVVLGTMALKSGQAAFSTASLGSGAHSITATFNSNATFAASTSTSSAVTVALAPASLVATYTAVGATQNGSVLGLSATVSSTRGMPQGTVTFLADGTILGTGILNPSGVATLSVASPLSGSMLLTASVAGDKVFAPSVSPALAETFAGGPDFSIALGAATVTLAPRRTAMLPLALRARGGFAAAVALSCDSGVPSGYICVFGQNRVDPDGATILTLAPTPANAALNTWSPRVAALLLGGLVLLPVRRRRIGLLMLVPLGLLLAIGITACGGGAKASPATGTVLTLKAAATAAGTVHEHAAQVTVLLPQ